MTDAPPTDRGDGAGGASQDELGHPAGSNWVPPGGEPTEEWIRERLADPEWRAALAQIIHNSEELKSSDEVRAAVVEMRRRQARGQLMPPVSVRVRDVHVEFELMGDRRDALRRKFVDRSGPGKIVVHAVRGVSFDLHEGDAVGIVGSNGSGKSTLLSALAGLLPPTSGEILTTEEPKLLGVGAALLPAATGYRNIRIGLIALGLTPDEVDDMVDEIVEFTELGDAIDRPLRTYSSGMRARLHFAISTAVKPRILLIDEALAVGDKKFKRKSRERIEALLAASGTLVLVSHNPNEIRSICNRGIWLEQGELRADGPIGQVLDLYGDD